MTRTKANPAALAMLALVLAALALALMLTEPSRCALSGGSYTQTGWQPITTMMPTGKALTPVTHITPTYECIGGAG